MNDFRCYTRDELKNFILGNLADDVCTTISDHLDQCDACEDTVVGLDKTCDSLLNILQTPVVESDKRAYEEYDEFKTALAASQQIANQIATATELDSEPNRIGDYEILSRLARGGMGSVFKARHCHLEKDVAIKILPERRMRTRDAIARFSREMKIIGQMSHPAMVSATDAGMENGIHYLVMELVDGMDLGKVVRSNGPLSIADACEVVRQAAIGIEYAHQQGVIHRDVKPSNLMLANDSIVKVLDLGLATLGGLTSAVDELTTVGQLMGTLDYMAPEQCGTSEEINERSDVYGLGATLYKLLAGAAPYTSELNDTPLKKLKAMATTDPTPISDRIDGLPDGVVEIVDRCLSRNSSQRFESAAAVAEALAPHASPDGLPKLLANVRAFREQRQFENFEPEPQLSLQRKTMNVGPSDRSAVAASPSGQPVLTTSVSASSRQGWGGRITNAMVACGFAGLIALAGIVIYISTATGQLMIESEVDGVEVIVTRNGEPTTDLKIEHGSKTTRLYAGDYRVEIKGDSESLHIEGDNFSLKRGGVVVARITKKPLSQPDSVINLQTIAPQRDNSSAAPAISNANKSEFESATGVDQAKNTQTMLEKKLLEQKIELEKLRQAFGEGHSQVKQQKSVVDLISQQLTALDPERNSPVQMAPKSSRTTYMGRDIEGWISDSLSMHSDAIEQSIPHIKSLQNDLSAEEKIEITKRFFKKYEKEIAPEFYVNLVSLLNPMCQNEWLLDLLFQKTISICERTALDQWRNKTNSPIQMASWLYVHNPEGLSRRMLELVVSKNSRHRALSIRWLYFKRYQFGQNESENANTIDSSWRQPLIGEVKHAPDLETRYKASRILSSCFAGEQDAMRALRIASAEDKTGRILSFSIDAMLDADRNDQTIPEEYISNVEKQKYPVEEFVLKTYKMHKAGDDRLLNQIVSKLEDNTWGWATLNEPMQRSAIVRWAPKTVRGKLVLELGLLAGKGLVSSDSEFAKLLTRPLQKQFDMEFNSGESASTPTHFLNIAAAAFSRISGIQSSEMFEGRQIAQWIETFKQSDDAPTHIRCLKAFMKLEQEIDDPRSIVLLVFSKLRSYPFESLDTEGFRPDSESLSSKDREIYELVAIMLDFFDISIRGRSYSPAGSGRGFKIDKYGRKERRVGKFYQAFIDSLDGLEDADAMMALTIFRVNNSRDGNSNYYIRSYVEAKNETIRRRAIYLTLRRGSNDSDQLAEELMASENTSAEMKRGVLMLYKTSHVNPSKTSVINAILREIKSPGDIHRLLLISGRESWKEPTISWVLAEQPKFLDEVHPVRSFDWWNGGVKESNPPDQSDLNKTLFELIIDQIDEKKDLMDVSVGLRESQWPEDFKKAVKTLKSRMAKADNATQRKLKRILKKMNVD
ncbi:MAG: serine/threonine protein kinase [Mariniblastus sp.]